VKWTQRTSTTAQGPTTYHTTHSTRHQFTKRTAKNTIKQQSAHARKAVQLQWHLHCTEMSKTNQIL